MSNANEYYKNIDICAETKRNQMIANGFAEHAVYLMTKMFSHAANHVRLFTGGLVDDISSGASGVPALVYKSPELIAAAERFLSSENSRLEILVQDNCDSLSSRAFVREINQKKSSGVIKGTVEIRKVSERNMPLKHHFMVLDESGYRLELDHEKTKAIANFGDSDFASKLATVFDDILFKNGSPVLKI
ncbi:MAG: hypothetical protein ACYDDA_00305 [Acidiferrobacteraceae bacterium]